MEILLTLLSSSPFTLKCKSLVINEYKGIHGGLKLEVRPWSDSKCLSLRVIICRFKFENQPLQNKLG